MGYVSHKLYQPSFFRTCHQLFDHNENMLKIYGCYEEGVNETLSSSVPCRILYDSVKQSPNSSHYIAWKSQTIGWGRVTLDMGSQGQVISRILIHMDPVFRDGLLFASNSTGAAGGFVNVYLSSMHLIPSNSQDT